MHGQLLGQRRIVAAVPAAGFLRVDEGDDPGDLPAGHQRHDHERENPHLRQQPVLRLVRRKLAQQIVVDLGEQLKAPGQEAPPEGVVFPRRDLAHQRIPQRCLRRIAMRHVGASDALVLDDADGAPVSELRNRDVRQRLGDVVVFQHADQSAELGQQVQPRLGQLAAVDVADDERDGAHRAVRPVDGVELAFLGPSPCVHRERLTGARQRHHLVDRPADHQLAWNAELRRRPADDLGARDPDGLTQGLGRPPVAIQDASVRPEHHRAFFYGVEQRAQLPILLAEAPAIRVASPFGDDGGLVRGRDNLPLLDLFDEVAAHQLAFAKFEHRFVDGSRERLGRLVGVARGRGRRSTRRRTRPDDCGGPRLTARSTR